MEMAVWRVPEQTKDRPELRDLIDMMHRYWKEHMLAKLAIPEVRTSYPSTSRSIFSKTDHGILRSWNTSPA